MCFKSSFQHVLGFIVIGANLCTVTIPIPSVSSNSIPSSASITGGCPFKSKRITSPPNLQYLGDVCNPGPQKCDPTDINYSADGSCNNLEYPNWGKYFTPFIRLLPAHYDDDFCSLRKSINGSALPLPRDITNNILKNKRIFDSERNIMFYGFGQWLDHDISFQNSPQPPPVTCCDGKKPAAYTDPDICIPQINRENDYFYGKYGVLCLDFQRSLNTKMLGCKLKPCAPVNQATAWIDLSIFYGDNATRIKDLRSLQGGRMKVEDSAFTSYQQYPSLTTDPNGTCASGGIVPSPDAPCFRIGDIRVGQNPELTIIEFVILGVHNYIADSLYEINRHWSDETLFQTARKILIGMFQHVSYKELLPLKLGPKTAKKYKIYPQTFGYASGYDEDLKGQTILSYEATAGRIIHSMIQGRVTYFNAQGNADFYPLNERYFNQSFLLGENMFLHIINAFVLEKCNYRDKFFVPETNNLLFPVSPTYEYGLDLSVLDITRGRDHGLAPYNYYRQYCGLCKLNQFAEFAPEIEDPTDVLKLQQLYYSVDDMDSYVGCALEKSLPGGVLGPTAACITGETYHRAKFSDRLFYEFKSSGFLPGQLSSIRQTTLAEMLCIANPSLKDVPRNAFLVVSSQNPLIRCDEITRINLQLWKDNKSS